MSEHNINGNQNNGSLIGRTLYVPRMSIEGASTMAAAYRALGVNGQVLPESNARTIELAKQYTIGEECYPEMVTLGGFLQVIEEQNFDPTKTAFLMPTAGGPCRFGQYKFLLEKILADKGLSEVMVVAPTSANGYSEMGGNAGNLVRLGWWAVVCADNLRKLLLQTRPYEKNIGETYRIHQECLESLCKVIERRDLSMKEKFAQLVSTMEDIKNRFDQIPANYTKDKPLIGVVGEIYCRLDDFSNSYLISRIEKFGGEVWLASISEWVFYTNFMEKFDRKLQGGFLTKEMLYSVIRNKVQLNDEHKLIAPVKERFKGYEEVESIKKLVEPVWPYLPYSGALGEMILNVGGTVYLYYKGVDGVVDISPFTCMNGIVCEAVYPAVSKDHHNIPIRNFYFDGTESDYDRDVEIFLELANTYKRRKKVKRKYPPHFVNS
jgi:predicted nucleotide-binding protein (sugar kinase/HSP70/actin superfamily)